ncbi:MAG: glycosyltransferase family 2 protein [Anaerolineales bacterium]|uniref:glycosyltransferase family 2 protein n=1 Tax=Promineifilum sp. TaxID=2664178 RepID=UPI001E15093F|nr:glycosyltransferase family 2 protein [Anaerolineales bacterium]MCO5180008.1 glycosyltransferase family 2 protein [Promineifilum sp.]
MISSPSTPPQKDLSLVIPVYNEEDNLRPLAGEICAALGDSGLDYEVIFIDDGSRDGSFARLQELAAEDSHVVAIRFRRNYGQTAAFAAGFDHARGRVIVTLDADRQNDPADILTLLTELDKGYDVVNGWRENRQDNVLRRLPSRVANWLIAETSGVHLKDRGCSLRAFRAEVVRDLHLYGELHRFIPELVNFAGFSMSEVPVNHRARVAGASKYGLSRTFRVILDLFTIHFLRKYGDRPMQLFGRWGIILFGLGALIGGYLTTLKLWAGFTGGLAGFNAMTIGDRPLLLLAVLLVILGVQFIVMGLIAELMVRTYYETQDLRVYRVKEIVGNGRVED